MNELINNVDLSDILLCGFFMGLVLGNLSDLVNSIIGYLHNKGWQVNYYEELIYKICNIQLRNEDFSLAFDLHRYGNLNDEDYEIMIQAINNYKKHLNRKEKREKFLNKFKKNK